MADKWNDLTDSVALPRDDGRAPRYEARCGASLDDTRERISLVEPGRGPDGRDRFHALDLNEAVAFQAFLSVAIPIVQARQQVRVGEVKEVTPENIAKLAAAAAAGTLTPAQMAAMTQLNAAIAQLGG